MTQPEMLTEVEKRSLKIAAGEFHESDGGEYEVGTILAAVVDLLRKRHLDQPTVRLGELDIPAGGTASVAYWPKTAEEAAKIVRAIPADTDWRTDRSGNLESLLCEHSGIRVAVYVPTPPATVETRTPHATAILNEVRGT